MRSHAPILAAISIFLFNVPAAPVRAQIIPDATLRNNSTVNRIGPLWAITEGETIGNNLFHSFSEFNLGAGELAAFQTIGTIENIIARVTGGTSSIVDGTLQAGANLFLINPRGIIFGPNAKLNIGGSFIASTAESVLLSDGSAFSAMNPQAPPLLAVNVPLGLQFGTNPGDLGVRSQELLLPDRTLGFIGGNVLLEGARVEFPRRIEIGSVGSNSVVSLTFDNRNIIAGYNAVGDFQDIQLSGQTEAKASGFGGGAIQIQGRRIAIADGSQVLIQTIGSQPGGDLFVRGTESVAVTGTDLSQLTLVSNDTLGAGAGGNLTIETGQFLLQGAASVSTRTFSGGTGGNLTIRALDRAVLAGVGFPFLEQFLVGAFLGQINPFAPVGGLFSVAARDGDSGEIAIEAGSLLLQNGAIAASPVFGRGSGGNIEIRTAGAIEMVGSAIGIAAAVGSQGSIGEIAIDSDQLTVRDGSLISSVTFGRGTGGDIAIAASDFVNLSQTLPNAILPTGITNNSFGTGAGGNIRVTAGRVMMRDGAIIGANSGGAIGTGVLPFGGPGGEIRVEARESIEIVGGAANNFAGQVGGVLPSGPGTTTFTSFPAGDLILRTGRLIVADGAIASSATLSSGDAGEFIVEASESVELRGTSPMTGLPASLATSSGRIDLLQLSATGNGSNLTLSTGALIVRDGATLDVRSFGSGAAGTLRVRADSIRLDRGSSFNASTVSGTGGNIMLNADLILLRRGSSITTDGGDADGGNIVLNAGNAIAVPTEDSDISANSLNSRGGNVTVNASGGIFGLQFRDRNTPLSDITATGRDSSQSGTVTLNTLGFDPASGLEQLPEDVTDPTNQIAIGCAAYAESRLVMTGRGGLPDNPTTTIPGQTVWRDLQDFSSQGTGEGRERDRISLSRPPSPVEAKGWMVNEAGNVELVAVLPQEQLSQSDSSCGS